MSVVRCCCSLLVMEFSYSRSASVTVARWIFDLNSDRRVGMGRTFRPGREIPVQAGPCPSSIGWGSSVSKVPAIEPRTVWKLSRCSPTPLTIASATLTLFATTLKKRSFLHVLGVDLGGGKGKKTAAATLRVDARNGATVVDLSPRPRELPLYDHSLLALLRGYGDDTLIAIDAPLTLPPCLRCQVPLCPGQADCADPSVVQMRADAASFGEEGRNFRRGKPQVTPYTQRATELRLFLERGITPREALGQGTGPLAARAAHLTRALADRFRLSESQVEVSPKATLAALGFTKLTRRHLHEREARAEVLEALTPDLRFGPGVWREVCVQSDHLFDAVIAAYTGYLWARDSWHAQLGPDVRPQEGWIWVPPQAAASGTPVPDDEEDEPRSDLVTALCPGSDPNAGGRTRPGNDR